MMFSIQCNTIQYNKKAIVSWLSTPAKGMVKFEPVVASKNIYIYISAWIWNLVSDSWFARRGHGLSRVTQTSNRSGSRFYNNYRLDRKDFQLVRTRCNNYLWSGSRCFCAYSRVTRNSCRCFRSEMFATPTSARWTPNDLRPPSTRCDNTRRSATTPQRSRAPSEWLWSRWMTGTATWLPRCYSWEECTRKRKDSAPSGTGSRRKVCTPCAKKNNILLSKTRKGPENQWRHRTDLNERKQRARHFRCPRLTNGRIHRAELRDFRRIAVSHLGDEARVLPRRNRHQPGGGQPRLGDPLHIHDDEAAGWVPLYQGATTRLLHLLNPNDRGPESD